MSEPVINFTSASAATTSVNAFKARIIEGCTGLGVGTLDFEEKHWRQLLSDIRDTLTTHHEVSVVPILKTPESGKIAITPTVVDFDFAVGKKRTEAPKHKGSTPEEVVGAIDALQSHQNATRLTL